MSLCQVPTQEHLNVDLYNVDMTSVHVVKSPDQTKNPSPIEAKERYVPSQTMHMVAMGEKRWIYLLVTMLPTWG